MPETRLAINPGLQSCTAFVTPANASLSAGGALLFANPLNHTPKSAS